MYSVRNLLLRTKSPVMLHKNILINNIDYGNYGNPIICIMRNYVAGNFISHFRNLMLGSFPHQKPASGKLISHRFDIRKPNKAITNFVFYKLSTIILKS
ncbi:hypothetical protein SAMN03159485_00843 [Pseudomonas sp. NFPP24]|nr:hypothetical protein SAMN03159485_00843 [Pseudomonas sp. NFPP24]